jgi:pimeloyl-ACP methyl ester carboxylesterase
LRDRRRTTEARRVGGCLLAASLAAGCVAMRPYAEVAVAVSAESLLEIDGRRVHVDARGAGEPLLLLHGFGASTLIWEAVIDGLARHRRVVAIDLNGFGWSERPLDRTSYTLEGQERLVLAVADRLGFERFDLAGHSYGGAISIFLASRHPARVRSLLLVDAAMPTYGEARRRRWASSRAVAAIYIRTVGLTAKRVRRGLEASYADDEKVTDELVLAYLGRLRIEGVVAAFHGLTAPNGEPPERIELERLSAPTLVVWGVDDEIITAEAGRAAAAKIPGAAYAEIAACGHSPMEECPAAFLAAVEPFLAEIR